MASSETSSLKDAPQEKSNLLADRRSINGEVSPLPAKHGATHTSFRDPPSIETDDTTTSSVKQTDFLYSLRERRPYLVEIPIFLFFLAYKGALPLKEQFVYSLITSQYTLDTSQSDGVSPSCALYLNPDANLTDVDLALEIATQEDSSELLSILNLVRNVPALFTTLLICSYTDVVGRRWGILLPCVGGALKGFAFLVVAYKGISYVSLLYVGEVLEGIGGSIMTAQNVAVAYVSDISHPDTRTFRFTIIQCLHYLGTALGNLFMGYLINTTGYIGSLWYTIALYVLCLLWVLFLLPESVAIGKTVSNFSPTATFNGAIMVFTLYAKKTRPFLDRVVLLVMLVPVIMDDLILLGRNDVDTLYMLAVPFCWTSIVIGLFQVTSYRPISSSFPEHVGYGLRELKDVVTREGRRVGGRHGLVPRGKGNS